jgi:hypothetical protein
MDPTKIDRLIQKIREVIYEDVPLNNLGSGKIAGTVEAGDDPPVRKRKRKYITNGRGSRKTWLDYLRTNNGRRN